MPAGGVPESQPGRRVMNQVAKQNTGAASGKIAMLGVPFDAGSSYLSGAAGAPRRIREVLYSGASNLTAEDGFVLDEPVWSDIGDLTCENQASDFQLIEQELHQLVNSNHRVLCLGGDHAITFPILKAYSRTYPGLTILHLDAHPDLYHELDGNRFSHACPFARIMENSLAGRLVQVGIRTMNAHQQEQARRFDVEVHCMRSWQPGKDLKLSGPLYLSVDIDVLDPAFAPGVSHHEPGGLAVRDLLGIIQAIEVPLVGADIVEYNPKRDINDMTAAVCAKLVKEVSAKLACGMTGGNFREHAQ